MRDSPQPRRKLRLALLLFTLAIPFGGFGLYGAPHGYGAGCDGMRWILLSILLLWVSGALLVAGLTLVVLHVVDPERRRRS